MEDKFEQFLRTSISEAKQELKESGNEFDEEKTMVYESNILYSEILLCKYLASKKPKSFEELGIDYVVKDALRGGESYVYKIGAHSALTTKARVVKEVEQLQAILNRIEEYENGYL